MSERLYCCVDGGGSKSRVALFDADGRRLGLTRTAPTSLTLYGDKAWPVILEALRDLCVQAELPSDELADVHFGIGLAGANNHAQRLKFLEQSPPVGALRVATDAYIAALGAHNGDAGAIIIIGTGSVGYRIEATGEARIAGGWGFPIGDEGSGAWLGRAALAQAIHVLENRHTSAASELHRALIERCGPSRDGLLSWSLGANATRYAELAAVVIECANRGDAAAVQLARQAGAEIDLLAEALDPGRSVALALTGGLAQPLTPYLPNALQEWIQAPYDDAVAGALLLAQGRAPDERII